MYKKRLKLDFKRFYHFSCPPPRRNVGFFDSSIVEAGTSGALHIYGMCMLLAQWLVFLGVEWLSLQIHVADRTDEAGVMPGVPQGFDKLIASFHRKITAMTLGAEQIDVVFLAVWLSILHVEEAVSKGFLAGCADEAGRVPCLSESVHHFPHDLGVALGTERSKKLLIAPLTVNIVLLLHEAHVCQGVLAVGTVELFRVPRAAHGYQKGAPDDIVAVATEGSPAASWEALSSLEGAPGKRGHLWTCWVVGWSSPGQGLLADRGGALSRSKLLREAVISHPGWAAGGLCRAPAVGCRWGRVIVRGR